MIQTAAFLEAAHQAADAAEPIIQHYFHSDLDVMHKEDASPVTLADIESEQAIREVLQTRFPEHGFFGEETGQAAMEAEFIWLVDPIDGTKSFVRRFPFFSTQIALMWRGEIILGLSNAPMMGQRAWATLGGGAFLNAAPVRVSETQRLDRAHISAGNVQRMANSPVWGRFGELITTAERFRGYGDFYHYHLLATGSVDLVLESDVNILDIAALALIVREAGGVFTDLSGNPVGLETRTVLAASTQELHGAVQSRLGWQPALEE